MCMYSYYDYLFCYHSFFSYISHSNLIRAAIARILLIVSSAYKLLPHSLCSMYTFSEDFCIVHNIENGRIEPIVQQILRL